MSKLGVGDMIFSLRKKIQDVKSELNELGEPTKDMPELITSANLLRSNEYLLKSNEKKSELLNAYEQYSDSLEEMLSAVFEIQNDLKNILKEQSSMISTKKTAPKKQTSKKVSKPKRKITKKQT